MQPFADACLASPIGASLVALLEQWQRPGRQPWISDDPSSDTELVRRAAERVGRISFGRLCELAIRASESVGPWTSGAELEAWASYLYAPERRPIAQAIAARFDSELHPSINLDAQEWWLHNQGAAGIAPLFEQLDQVYENGELSWHALRAYGASPIEVLEAGFGEAPSPSTRWAMPVTTIPRVFEIHRPDDWHDLCRQYPLVARRSHGTWALPGPNASRYGPLSDLSDQHAATNKIDVHLCPAWSQVAADYDAVHLSWAGFITAEGFVLTRDQHTTMLRFWEREVTMWLRDCFGAPSPLPLPMGENYDYLIDPTTSPTRLAQDQQVIATMLARHER